MFRYPSLFVFVLAFIIRIGYTMYILQIQPESIYQYDSWGYLNIAENLYQDQVFSQMLNAPQTPDGTRTPFYPAFIVLFHILQLGGKWIVIFQALLGAFTALITYRIADIISRNRPVNVLSGILVAMNLPSIFMGNVVATECLFSMIVATSLYYAVKGIKFKEESAITLSVFLMVVATLIRPITFYFMIFIPIGYFLLSGFGFFRRLKTLAFHLIIIGVFIGPWIYRNQSTFGSPFYSSISEVNILFHTSTQIRAIAEGRPQKSIEMEYRNDSLKHLDFVNDTKSITPFIAFARNETRRVVTKNPEVFAKMWAKSTLIFFIKPMRSYFNMQLKGEQNFSPITSVENRSKGNLIKRTWEETDNLTLMLVAFQILMLSIAYIGILFSLKYWLTKDLTIFALFISLLAYLALMSGLTEVDARLRIPAIPILAILCLPAYTSIFDKLVRNPNE